MRHHAQTLRHKSAVESHQFDDITHRAERNNIEQCQQIRLRPARIIKSRITQHAIGGNHKQIGHANGGEISVVTRFIEAVWIHHRHSRRKRGFRRMVIENDNVRASILGCFHRFMRRCTTINADDELDTFIRQLAHGSDVGTIAFAETIRHIKADFHTKRTTETNKKRRRGCAINIIIAIDSDFFATLHRIH